MRAPGYLPLAGPYRSTCPVSDDRTRILIRGRWVERATLYTAAGTLLDGVERVRAVAAGVRASEALS